MIKSGAWPVPPIFDVIQRGGDVSFEEMRGAFNIGIGMFVAIGTVRRDGA